MTKLNETWRKATRSNNNGACVEVRAVGGDVQLRDSKDGGRGPVLTFTPEEFEAFADGVVKGEFEI